MTSRDLLVVACDTIGDTSALLPLKKAAVEALLSAASDGLALPPGAARLLWSFWANAPGSRSWRYADKIGDVPDERVRAEATHILERHESGDDLRDLATDVLAGKGHAAHVEHRLLLALAERARDEREAHRLARLVGAVHEARGIELPILRMVRDRWAVSSVPGVRECSLLVAREIVEPDLPFVERMLADPDADVRGTTADELTMGLPGRELALGAVEARLRVEVHPHALAALLRAQASLVEDAAPPRRRRR